MTGVGSARSIHPGPFPAYFPVPAPPVPAPTRKPILSQHCPRLPRELWPEIAERARHESLHDLAEAYGVSHETIRTIVRRVTKTEEAM